MYIECVTNGCKRSIPRAPLSSVIFQWLILDIHRSWQNFTCNQTSNLQASRLPVWLKRKILPTTMNVQDKSLKDTRASIPIQDIPGQDIDMWCCTWHGMISLAASLPTLFYVLSTCTNVHIGSVNTCMQQNPSWKIGEPLTKLNSPELDQQYCEDVLVGKEWNSKRSALMYCMHEPWRKFSFLVIQDIKAISVHVDLKTKHSKFHLHCTLSKATSLFAWRKSHTPWLGGPTLWRVQGAAG